MSPFRRAFGSAALLNAAFWWPAMAPAQGPSYNYLDAAYLAASPDEDNSPAERSGYEVTLSSPLEPQHFMHLRYQRSKADVDNARTSMLRAGLGYSGAFNASSDVYLILAYEDHKIRDRDDTGYSAELGMRWLLSSRLEINGGGNYQLLDDAGEQIGWFGGLALSLTPGVALVGRYELGEDETRYSVGLRLGPELSPGP